MEKSESFFLSALLSFSGGLQDAYTYNVRGKVFANAQTGNVVLMSQNLMSGQWLRSLYYLCPLVAFALGVFAAEKIESRFRSSGKSFILLLEMAALALVGLMPSQWDMGANALVSFSCAMQVQAFRKVHGYGYASTMCIGNLRSGTESLSRYLRTKDREALVQAGYLFGIIFVFALGAGLGGILSAVTGIRTIWFSVAILALAALLMGKNA